MLRFLTILGISLACLVPAVAENAHAQKPILMRYKPGLNEPLIYRTVETTKQSQASGGKKLTTDISRTEIVIRTLTRIDNNKNLQLHSENKFLQYKVKNSRLGQFAYDSTTDENEKGSMLGGALTPVFDTLHGSIITEVLSTRGEVIEVKGYEELLAAPLKDNPIGEQFLGRGTNKIRKFELGEYYPILSKKRVKPGDTWDESFEFLLPDMGTAKGIRKYKFEAYETAGKSQLAKISFTIDVKFKLDFEQGGQKVNGEISTQKSSGTVYFDPQKGRLISLKTEFTMGGTINVVVRGQERTITTTQTKTGELKLLDKLPGDKKLRAQTAP